jgi:hypothetical protein
MAKLTLDPETPYCPVRARPDIAARTEPIEQEAWARKRNKAESHVMEHPARARAGYEKHTIHPRLRLTAGHASQRGERKTCRETDPCPGIRTPRRAEGRQCPGEFAMSRYFGSSSRFRDLCQSIGHSVQLECLRRTGVDGLARGCPVRPTIDWRKAGVGPVRPNHDPRYLVN